jgi:hypothetical protein
MSQCKNCNQDIKGQGNLNAGLITMYSTKRFEGGPYCLECQKDPEIMKRKKVKSK